MEECEVAATGARTTVKHGGVWCGGAWAICSSIREADGGLQLGRCVCARARACVCVRVRVCCCDGDIGKAAMIMVVLGRRLARVTGLFVPTSGRPTPHAQVYR